MSDNDVAAAMQLLELEKKDRVERCKAKINAILAEENCQIDVQMIVSLRGAQPILNIIAL